MMKKMTQMIPVLLLGIALLSTTAVMAMDPDEDATGGVPSLVSVKLTRTFADDCFAGIAATTQQSLTLAREQIRALCGPASTPARDALEAEFPGVVTPEGRIIGEIDSSMSAKFLELKRKADVESVVANATRSRLSNLESNIQSAEEMLEFCTRAPKVLGAMRNLLDVQLPKEEVYQSAFGKDSMPTGCNWWRWNSFGHFKSKEQLTDESLAHFTMGIKLNGELYLDLANIEKFLNNASPKSDVPAIKVRLAQFVKGMGISHTEINDWIAAFPDFANAAKYASQAAKNQISVVDAKLTALLAKTPVNVAAIEATTIESEALNKIKIESVKQVTTLKAVQKWFEELAEHLRKNGFVS